MGGHNLAVASRKLCVVTALKKDEKAYFSDRAKVVCISAISFKTI